MSDPDLRWSTTTIFPVLLSGARLIYGGVFTDIRHSPTGAISTTIDLLKSMFHPLFIGGMILVLSGSLVRIFLSRCVRVGEAVILSELTLRATFTLEIIVFDSSPAITESSGTGLVVTGVSLVQSDGGVA